jgi:hypothetical protein
MVARGEDHGHLAAAGVFQGAFCRWRSGRASAKMAFEFPIRLYCQKRYLWAQQQANAIRDGDWDVVDREHVAEEIEDL